jgi:hypothetical protein
VTLTTLGMLCQREWNRDFGDVIELRLTDESLRALAAEPGAWHSLTAPLPASHLPAIQAGAMTTVMNPITRSVIQLMSAATDEAESALVSFGAHREAEIVLL